MNAKDLSGFDVVLELILVVFLSPNQSGHYNQCKQMLLDLIESRPVIEDELEEIIRKEINSKLNPLSKASTSTNNVEVEETDESKEN